MILFPAEFIRHANICNQYAFRRPRYKRYFYKWKTEFLRRYGRLVGYDYQSFNSFFCQTCYGRVNDRQIKSCRDNECPGGGEWAGGHEHILARMELVYLSDEASLFPNHPASMVYHIPMNEYRYEGTVHSTMSANFLFYRDQCTGRIGLKQEQPTAVDVDPFTSLKWLIGYCQQQGLIPVRERLPRELPF